MYLYLPEPQGCDLTQCFFRVFAGKEIYKTLRFDSPLQALLLSSTYSVLCKTLPRRPDTYKSMRSFSLSLIATVAFAAFSVAACLPAVAAVSTSNTTNGTADLSTVPAILTSVNSRLIPIQGKLCESRSV